MAISKIKLTDGTVQQITVDLSNIKNADDLKAIEALTAVGFLKRTGDNTWTIDTTTYQTLISATNKLNAAYLSGTASIDTTGSAASASTSTTQSAGDNTTNIATTAFVATAINNALEDISGAMKFKGVVNSDSDLPSSHKAGYVYIIGTAGTYNGEVCEVGDMIIATGTGASAWAIVQTNIDGAVTGPSSAVSGNVATYNGSTGKAIQDSGVAIDNLVLTSDSRLSDARTPLSHAHGNITNDGKVGSTADLAVYTTTSGTVTAGSLATSDPTAASTTATTFIDTVSQDSKGKISATKKTLPVTSVTMTRNLTSGTQVGTLTINGTSYVLYAPTAVTLPAYVSTPSTNSNYPVLFKNSTSTTTTAAGDRFDASAFYYNPSTDTLTVTNYAGSGASLTNISRVTTSSTQPSTKYSGDLWYEILS